MEIIDKILEKSRAEEQLGLTELTVNSCFSALSLFSSIHFPFLCAPTSIFFAFLSKKVPGKGVAFQIFYIPLHADTHSAHAELMLFLAFHGEDLLRRGLGREGITT